MENLVLEVIKCVVPPVLGGACGLILAHLRSKKALDSCIEAKKACNDEVHYLQNQISSLKSAVFVAQGRIVGLEHEFEERIRQLET